MPTPAKKPGSEMLVRAIPALTVIVALAYALAAYLLLIAPKIARLRVGGEFDLSMISARLSDEQTYAEALASSVAAYRAVSPDLRSRVENVVTDTPDVPGLFVQLDRIASANGFQLASVDASSDMKTVLSGDRRVVRISANVTGGGYAEFKRFLMDLERSERIIDAQSVVFTPATGSYAFVLRAYYVDPFALPAVPAAGAPVVPSAL